MISRKGKEEKAASKFPLNNCQVPKLITATVNKIINIAALFFIAGIVAKESGICPEIY